MPGSNTNGLAESYGVNVNPSTIAGFGSGSGSGSGSFGSALAGIGGLASSIINPILQLITNRSNRLFAEEQAKLENQWNIEQWNRENAYNTPAAQMQRYIDAGLNPNLVVGQQNLSASSPAMTSAKDAPAAIAPQLALGQGALQAAQVRNLNAQSDQLESQSSLAHEQIKLISSQLGLNEKQSRLLEASIAVEWEAVKEVMSRVDLNKKLSSKTDLETAFADATFNANVQRIKAALYMDSVRAYRLASVIEASIAESASRAGLNWQTSKLHASQIKLNEKEEALKLSLSDYYSKLANKTATEKDLLEVQKRILETYGDAEKISEINKNNRSNRSFIFSLTHDMDQIIFAPFDLNVDPGMYN